MTVPPNPLHVAIDLGAGSGRALVGGASAFGFQFREVHRFHYGPRRLDGRLRWEIDALFAGVRRGLQLAHAAAAEAGAALASIGVDSWGVDYGLVDAGGRLVEDPICYRDERTDRAMAEVFARVPRDEIYRRTGIQFHQFNTLYQLWAHVRDGLPPGAATLLLMPDLCHHLLCGSLASERTDASTTQLLTSGGQWDDGLFDRLGLPKRLMPEVVAAGARIGTLRPELCRELGVPAVDVVAPGTHDTASAVAGTPLAPGWAYISSGTWSLVGVERDAPIVSEAAAEAGLTNEAGVFGSVRLLTNVMGLWLLESCRREWAAEGRTADLDALLAAAEAAGPSGVVFPDDHRFFAPARMSDAIRGALRETGQRDHDEPALVTRVILDSLALRYAAVVDRIERVTGQPIPGIHIVGGGSLNRYLNQATADASGRPVLAGPAEATATGNLLVQAIATGTLASLAAGRQLVAGARPPEPFEPRHPERWRQAAALFRDVAAHAHQEPTA